MHTLWYLIEYLLTFHRFRVVLVAYVLLAGHVAVRMDAIQKEELVAGMFMSDLPCGNLKMC